MLQEYTKRYRPPSDVHRARQDRGRAVVNSTKSTAQRFTNALSFQTRTSIGRAFGAELQPQNRPPSEALLASHAANRAAQCIRTAKRMIALLEPACLSYDELVEKSQGSPRFQFCQMHCSTHPYGTTHQGSSFESGALVGYCQGGKGQKLAPCRLPAIHFVRYRQGGKEPKLAPCYLPSIHFVGYCQGGNELPIDHP